MGTFLISDPSQYSQRCFHYQNYSKVLLRTITVNKGCIIGVVYVVLRLVGRKPLDRWIMRK